MLDTLAQSLAGMAQTIALRIDHACKLLDMGPRGDRCLLDLFAAAIKKGDNTLKLLGVFTARFIETCNLLLA